jgi:hypothetical protein
MKLLVRVVHGVWRVRVALRVVALRLRAVCCLLCLLGLYLQIHISPTILIDMISKACSFVRATHTTIAIIPISDWQQSFRNVFCKGMHTTPSTPRKDYNLVFESCGHC